MSICQYPFTSIYRIVVMGHGPGTYLDRVAGFESQSV